MRRVVFLFFLVWIAVPVFGQSVRTASPPVVTVELSSIEPLPPNYPREIFYGGVGGGGDDAPPRRFTQPDWFDLPSEIVSGRRSYISACGFTSRGAPAAVLTTPSGANQTLEAYDESMDDFDETRCYTFYYVWSYGIELGLYTLTLAHPDGNLSYTWGIEYPDCPTLGYNPDGGDDWLMGFQPNQALTLVFFAFIGDAVDPTFVASRALQADSEGALLLNLRVARSAPFTRDDLIPIVVSTNREILYYDRTVVGVRSFLDQGFTFTDAADQAAPPARYLSYQLITSSFGGCSVNVGRFGHTTTAIPLYTEVNGALTGGQVDAGMPVSVLESVPAMTDNWVKLWYHLRLEDGREGWGYGPHLSPIYTTLVAGGEAETLLLQRFNDTDFAPIDMNSVLLDAPDGAPLRELAPETVVRLIGQRPIDNRTWWYVQLNDGTRGWLPEYDPLTFDPTLSGLPWRLEDLRALDPSFRTCPGSPNSRLTTSRTGRVLPGPSNRLRSTPESGEVIDTLPAGTEFEIIRGPVCGANNGLTWWGVGSIGVHGFLGWTAEGEGDTYWLELLPDS